MAEETKNPSRNVPNAMTGSMILVRFGAEVERNELTWQTYVLAYIVS
jgi:amino acid transporter